MGFWIFSFIMCTFIPVIMIIIGKIFKNGAPNDINYLFGYRTTLSMKNKDTWEFAHKHCGRLWFKIGIILLPLCAVPMVFFISKDTDTVGNALTLITAVQVVVLILSVIPTQRALKKTFDDDGKRKEK